MSGIEIAGLVLGAFPVVISALEGYREAFAPLKRWWRFQRTFEDFIDDLGTQQIFFDNNLEKLLSPFVSSEVQMGILLSDPFGDLWQSPDLDEKLKARLGSSFVFYKSIVNRMFTVLMDLQELLGLKNGQAIDLWSNSQSAISEVEKHFKRLRISFSEKKFHHVETLSKRNEDLGKLLQSSDELAPMRKQRRTAPNTVFLKQLQSRALSLHKVLAGSWICSCTSAHTTQLRLERRLNDKLMEGENWKVLLPEASHNNSQPSFTEVEVIFKEDDNNASQAIDPDQADLVTSTDRVLNFKQGVEADLASLNLSKSTAKVQGSVKVTGKHNTKSGAKVNLFGHNASRPTANPLGKKITNSKHVTFSHCQSSVKTTRKSAVPPPLQPKVLSQPIDDLCMSLKSMTQQTTCLGFIEDTQKRRHEFYPLHKTAFDHDLTLQTALTPSSTLSHLPQMSRQDRFTIAVVLASSLLQLHTTPWLEEKWNKSHVVLHVDVPRQRIIPKPLLCAKFHSSAPRGQTQQASSANAKFNAKKALSSLGIMLLELCFGQAIENHPLRPQYFGPDSQPNAFTDISTAKEWHEDVLGEMGDDMSDAIRRCLDCSFAPKPDLSNTEFQEAVFEGVVLPLQDILKIWEKP